MATHSSILAWKIPWAEILTGYNLWGPQKVRRDWATETHRYRDTHAQLFCLFCGFKMSVSKHMLSSVTIEIFFLNLSYFHDFLLSDLKFCLLYQSYPHHYLRGDGVMLWYKAQAVNSWWLQMKSIGMFVVLYFNCFFCLKCFKIKHLRMSRRT